jgi:hypothetical protein
MNHNNWRFYMVKRSSSTALSIITIVALSAIAMVPSFAQSNAGVSTQTTQPHAVAQANAPDFGSPPSGSIPILYNDHHVYAKPDLLKQGRVLAAFAKGGTLFIPVRSMFEEMGATVHWDAGSKTMDIAKAGSEVKLTVGKPEVEINGEPRPLDVPPEVYQGVVIAPIRVISEAMGAYVQWLQDQRTVVVRYAPPATPPPATPAPPPPETPAPATPAPTPPPTPAPPTHAYESFVAVDYTFAGKAWNEFSAGNATKSSARVDAAVEFPLFSLPWMAEFDYYKLSYNHNQSAATLPINPGCRFTPGDPGCVTVIGGQGQTFVPSFQASEGNFEAKFGLRVFDPRVYVAIADLDRTNNYGYPGMNSVGIGVEKLPDLDHLISLRASFYYYPYLNGKYTDPFGNTFTLGYRTFTYDLGFTVTPIKTIPVFAEAGWRGENDNARNDAPSNRRYNAFYGGLGLHF